MYLNIVPVLLFRYCLSYMSKVYNITVDRKNVLQSALDHFTYHGFNLANINVMFKGEAGMLYLFLVRLEILKLRDSKFPFMYTECHFLVLSHVNQINI